MSKKTSSKLNVKTVIEELKTPGLIILGMVAGNVAGKLIDKFIVIDPTAQGFQAKALIKPLVQITAGLGGAILLKDRNMKLIASGFAASGIASTVKVFLKKDILQGFTGIEGLDGLEAPGDAQVFREPLNLSIEPYNPDLPSISSVQFAALPIESETELTGDLGEYTEVKEVQIV